MNKGWMIMALRLDRVNCPWWGLDVGRGFAGLAFGTAGGGAGGVTAAQATLDVAHQLLKLILESNIEQKFEE